MDTATPRTSTSLVWYVSYGSNMCRTRLEHYLHGGQMPGARRAHPGARDHSAPRASRAVQLPGRLYFAGESPTWTGGVAFYDHDTPGPTPARAHLMTIAQFTDVTAQEMHRIPRDGDPLEEVVINGLSTGRHQAGPGRYETLIEVGRCEQDIPMITFTAPHGISAVEHTRPAPAYLDMLAAGLEEAHGWDRDRADAFFDSVMIS